MFQSPSHLMFFKKCNNIYVQKLHYETLGGGLNSSESHFFVASGKKCKRKGTFVSPGCPPALKCCQNDHPRCGNGGARSSKLYGRCCLHYCFGRLFGLAHFTHSVSPLFPTFLLVQRVLLFKSCFFLFRFFSTFLAPEFASACIESLHLFCLKKTAFPTLCGNRQRDYTHIHPRP